MNNAFILASLVTLLLSGCATPYGPQKGSGIGYSDIQVNTDSFIVAFKGLSPLRTKELALLRSAEVALSHGFAYFVVTQVDDMSTISLHNDSIMYPSPHYGFNVFPYMGMNNQVYTLTRPHYVYTIICYVGRPETPSYSARMVIDNINPK